MKNLLMILLMGLFLFSACSQNEKESEFDETNNETIEEQVKVSENEKQFLKNLASLCGKSFRGKETYMKNKNGSWVDNELIMHVTVCEDDIVKIPFHVDDDKSRTWIFMLEDGNLRFRHDHRHEDGTPEDLTLYGGYADGSGSQFIQIFPADDYTKNLVGDHIDRTWVVMLDEKMTTMTYKLRFYGEKYFEAKFDLTNPL